MRAIDKIISTLEQYIKNKVYFPVETDQLELKDLSGGDDWQELYRTICAFLNTKGGIIVIGIKEDIKNKCYKFTGFPSTQSTEEKIKNFSNQFTDQTGNPLNLSDYISPNLVEIKPFLDGNICLVFVEKLPDDKKFVFYKGNAYERQLTGDHKLAREKILQQEELVEELRDAAELKLVAGVTIDDLNIELLNDFIEKLNAGKKVETKKEDLSSALSFLRRRNFIRDNSPTLLGMLVCGKYIFDYVRGKCEVDAYFEMLGKVKTIADDRRIYKENIFPLMESVWDFVVSKINVGISVENGGTTIYEYPEDVIRESINNALAHRDYTSDRFSILVIRKNKYIEIRNPGKFRQEQFVYQDCPTIRLRRIIPVPKTRNVHLADVLKAYKRWEGRGVGMATLINYALDNQIDVPYYILRPGSEISLYIPKGEVLDEQIVQWLRNFDKYIKKKTNGTELTKEQQVILAYLYKSERLNANERFTVNLSKDNNHFGVINDLLSWNLIEKMPQSTPELELFRVDPILKKENFTEDLQEIFGSDYDTLPVTSKDILQTIYLHDEYRSAAEVDANFIGNFLYSKSKNTSQIDLKAYNDFIDLKEFNAFKRKTRNEISKLERKGFIVKKNEGKINYSLNKIYQPKSI